MQATNYQLFYPDLLDKSNPSHDAKQKAKLIGKSEMDFYQRMIDSFNLKNISIKPYESIVNNERYEYYSTLCKKLLDNPLLKSAFSELSADLINRQEVDTPEKMEQAREYAINEIAWILSKDGIKVSHPNEAKIGYDPLAFIIKNIENEAERIGIENVFENNDDLEKILNKVLVKSETFLSDKIMFSSGNQKKYYTQFKKFLYGEKKGKQSKD